MGLLQPGQFLCSSMGLVQHIPEAELQHAIQLHLPLSVHAPHV